MQDVPVVAADRKSEGRVPWGTAVGGIRAAGGCHGSVDYPVEVADGEGHRLVRGA